MAIIYTYPTKATPVDNDLILISDSADSNKTKQITVASIKGQTAGVTSIVAGNNVTISSTGASGTGDVTVNAAGGGTFSVKDSGGTAITGIDTLDFNTNLSLIHAPGSSTVTINASSGSSVDTFTNAFGTYITGTANSTATGAVDMGTINLSATGTADNTTFLRGDNTWAIPTGSAPQGDDGQYQYKNGSSFAGSDSLRFDSDKIHIGKSSGTPTRGQLVMYGDGTNASDIQLYNSGNNRFLKLAQQAGATQDLTLTFPGQASGGNNKILESDSSGQLSWIDTPTAGAVSTYTNAGSNRILTSSGTGVINGESSLLYNGSILTLGASKVFNASRSSTTPGVSTAPIYVTNSTTGSGAPTNFASNIAGGAGSRHMEFYHGGTAVGNIQTDSTSTTYNTSSDYRLKENVTEMIGSIDRVKQLKPSRFNFVSDTNKIVDGFLAHEAASVVPESVTGYKDQVDEDGNAIYQGIDQSKLVPLLVGAIKELTARIEALEA